MTLAELADVAEVERLALRPEDMVVIKVPWRLTDEEAGFIKARTDDVFPAGQKVVLLDGGVDIAVLRAEEAPVCLNCEGAGCSWCSPAKEATT